MPTKMIWTTSFCNMGHRMSDGKPVEHECCVLPPKALRMEYLGNIERAIEIIDAAKPMRTMRRGVKR